MKTLSATLVTLILLFPLAAVSQKVGTAVRIVNTVKGDHNRSVRSLDKNDPVFASEKITAAADAHGEIKLSDNSRIIVGPGAKVSLDDFVVDAGGVKSGVINIAKGSFRFLSGRSKKAKFKITTPLATIGLRGTIFDVYVGARGVTNVILFSGSLDVCTKQGFCRQVRENCDIIRIRPGNNLRTLDFLRSGVRSAEDRKFDLITHQSRFPFGWRAPTASCDRRAALAIGRDSPEAKEPKEPKGRDEPEDEPIFED